MVHPDPDVDLAAVQELKGYYGDFYLLSVFKKACERFSEILAKNQKNKKPKKHENLLKLFID